MFRYITVFGCNWPQWYAVGVLGCHCVYRLDEENVSSLRMISLVIDGLFPLTTMENEATQNVELFIPSEKLSLTIIHFYFKLKFK